MIDKENEIYTIIATRLRQEFPSIFVTGEVNLNPTRYPCAFIEEADNSSLTTSRDTGSNERHVVLMYEVNVFSNKQSGKKSEAKAIFAVIDDEFDKLGFTRQTKVPISIDEGTKYRIVGRWTAVANNDYIFRR